MDPKERPAYSSTISQLITDDDCLSWSNEDRLVNEGRAAVLGNSLSDAHNLFNDLQLKYRTQ